MEFDNRKILIAVVAITLLLFPVVAFTSGTLRIALGLPFVVFFPGYTLLSALFPRRDDLSGLERVALSFGLSIAVVPLIGLALNYTPWGIRPYPILISIALFIGAASLVGWYRQQKLLPHQRFSVAFRASAPRWAGMPRLDRALSGLLVLAILAALGTIGYTIATPKESEKFTEFYILNREGKAADYPQHATVGEPVALVIGVVNHEYELTSYEVRITIDGVEDSRIDIGPLAHEEKWEKEVSFTPQLVGEQEKVELQLYKDGDDEPYFEDPLHLYIDVYQ